jgi:G3E family GTPase
MNEVNLYAAYERRQHDAARRRPPLPVTILTGQLGAGKTTLLRRILQNRRNLRVSAIVNDFGAVDHDGQIVERDQLAAEVQKLAGGCFCCHTTLNATFKDQVWTMLDAPDHGNDKPDYLVVEVGLSVYRALRKQFLVVCKHVGRLATDHGLIVSALWSADKRRH